MEPTRPRPPGVLTLCLLLALCMHGPPSRASDTVSRDQPLSGGQRMVSQGGRFALGFFQPDVTAPDRWYLAIWYNKISKHTPVWIANRGRPISDPNSSKLTISEDGNMVLLDRLESPMWATNITRNISNSTGQSLDGTRSLVTPHASYHGRVPLIHRQGIIHLRWTQTAATSLSTGGTTLGLLGNGQVDWHYVYWSS
ncbi:hypothetical protein PVAP13_5NG262540 [Panicum virgatum]|uniref:non-specific serine/threonine protein kinase n=1 Tax=Panicum virgatum TaxID=38727 RepID=A0A8T0RV54_PANVG|nr:hypothetical protein PVAP13_5NG262540 [Panicum virgatum]KAG2590413.1 hypothetical protein PVAP13_5NG262540 [Panicum virgatum]